MTVSARPPRTEHRDGYTVSDDPARLDVEAIHAFLTACYWSKGIPRETVARAVAHSLGFGLYASGVASGGASSGAQIGFVRAVTDQATFAYLCDVYVLDAHRGRGLGEWLVGFALADPALQQLRRMILATRDAHGLYQRFGFAAPKWPDAYMDIVRPDIYLGEAAPAGPGGTGPTAGGRTGE